MYAVCHNYKLGHNKTITQTAELDIFTAVVYLDGGLSDFISSSIRRPFLQAIPANN